MLLITKLLKLILSTYTYTSTNLLIDKMSLKQIIEIKLICFITPLSPFRPKLYGQIVFIKQHSYDYSFFKSSCSKHILFAIS